MSIKKDQSRFKDIVKGRVRENLKKYITHNSLTGRRENDLVKIPIDSIDIPNFRFGKGEDQQGVGQGSDGDGGDGSDGSPSQGSKPGNESGEHVFEAEMTVSELADILGETLQLPQLQPKGNNNLQTTSKKYSTLAPTGPAGLRNFKQTYKKALKKSISSGKYNYKNPQVIPNRPDFIYKSPKSTSKPFAQAVVFYIMDISGSMGDNEKNIVKTEIFWLNAWLRKHYKGLESRFIVHEAKSWEVKEEEFFTITASGGTLISSSYECCLKIIEEEYDPNDWNIYIFQFSDGDNWSGEDSNKCMKILEEKILPIVNSFNYGQVESKYGSGNFYKEFNSNSKVSNSEKLKLSIIRGKDGSDGILKSIKDFLGKG